MLAEYRRRLERELDLLGNAGHDPYSLGQANMAKRALEMLGEEFIGRGPVAYEPGRDRRRDGTGRPRNGRGGRCREDCSPAPGPHDRPDAASTAGAVEPGAQAEASQVARMFSSMAG
jgi:hypothetical protein